MALLGLKKKQAFGQVPMMGAEPMTMGAPVQGMGQMADITNMPAMAQQPMQEEGKRKPNWLGIVGDSLQILGGGQATYVPQMREQQQRAELLRQRALEAQQARETGWQDWVAKEEWKKKNETPRVNDTEQDYNFWKDKVARGEITQEQFNDKLFAPKYVIDQETGQTIRIGGAPTFSPAPQGVTFTPVEGGPVQQAPGNFRPKGY